MYRKHSHRLRQACATRHYRLIAERRPLKRNVGQALAHIACKRFYIA